MKLNPITLPFLRSILFMAVELVHVRPSHFVILFDLIRRPVKVPSVDSHFRDLPRIRSGIEAFEYPVLEPEGLELPKVFNRLRKADHAELVCSDPLRVHRLSISLQAAGETSLPIHCHSVVVRLQSQSLTAEGVENSSRLRLRTP